MCRELAVVQIQGWDLDKVALVVDDSRLCHEITFHRLADPLGATEVLHRVTLTEETLIRLDHPLRLFDLHEMWGCQVEVRARFLDQNIHVATR